MRTEPVGCLGSGINLNKSIQIARALGIRVTSVRRTGEIRFSFPGLERSVRVNGRRKDAPLALIKFINDVLRIQRRAA
jgi:hypothetical protein